MSHLAAISESFDVELKGWLDPAAEADAAKIARACIALRNNNGGKLIFGFDDKTLVQLRDQTPADIPSTYHSDIIHRIIGKYALPRFDVEIVLEEKDGIVHPIILIRSGVESPVMTRAACPGELRQNTVYVRCLSNATISSAEPKTPQDWDRLMRICFDNREADIGRFFARHLPRISSAIRQFDEGTVPEQVLKQGRNQFQLKHKEMVEKKLAPNALYGFREVAFWVNGEIKRLPMADFAQQMFLHRPHYTGWPPWANLSGAERQEFRPYVKAQGWEAYIVSSCYREHEIDFWRMEPVGKFYHLQNT